MHKIAQKVTSIALAASMLLSMFATNTVAFADEFTDSTTVSEDATEAPASGEVDAVESVDETDTDNPEAVDEPTETPEPTPSVTDVVDLTHDSTTDTVKDDTTGSEDVVLTDSDESEENTATPETAETFVGIQAVTPEYGDRITANVGDTVTLDALLNRDDVAVTYQWQKKQDFVANEADALYPYEEGEPTWYDFVWEDSTEAETLADTPDFVWQGCEMYFAVVDALDAIDADTSDVQLAWHTPNFVLDGYAITAGKTDDGTTEVYATNEENTYTARLNEDGKWEFSDESTVALTTDWQSIDGATDASYTFEVTNEDLSASYRCLITVVDEAYREENFKALEDLGTELTDEDKKGDIILSTVQFKVISDEATEETVDEDNMPATYASLADSFAVYSADGPALSSDNQWITGLNGNYEYITKNMYDQVTEWFNAGSFAYATICGILLADPRVRTTPSGKNVTEFRVGAAHNRVNKKTNTWVNNPAYMGVYAWEPLGDFISKNFKQDSGIHVIGELVMNQFTAKDGTKRTTYRVKALTAKFLNDADDNQTATATPAQAAQPTVSAANYGGISAEDFESVDDLEDLPF